METEPVAIVLKFAFLGGLLLFLFWIAASGVRTLRSASAAGVAPGRSQGVTDDGWLVALGGGSLTPGSRYDAFGGLTIGRSDEADVQISDSFASSLHARIYSGQGGYYLEDMGSTNGTYLNGMKIDGAVELNDLNVIRIGEVEMRFELGRGGSS